MGYGLHLVSQSEGTQNTGVRGYTELAYLYLKHLRLVKRRRGIRWGNQHTETRKIKKKYFLSSFWFWEMGPENRNIELASSGWQVKKMVEMSLSTARRHRGEYRYSSTQSRYQMKMGGELHAPAILLWGRTPVFTELEAGWVWMFWRR